MGYDTNFRGEFKFSRQLTVTELNTLQKFSKERHGDSTKEHSWAPSFYCQWEPNEDGTALRWNGAEKFYQYNRWLAYLIEVYFTPWGVKLNGKVDWRGEEFYDAGTITVTDNVIKTAGR